MNCVHKSYEKIFYIYHLISQSGTIPALSINRLNFFNPIINR